MKKKSTKAPVYKIQKLQDGSHKYAGRYDNAARWYPNDEFKVPGSFAVRSPSRAWPYSYLKSFYTVKYAKILATYKPNLYMNLQDIEKDTEEGQLFLAWVAKNKILN